MSKPNKRRRSTTNERQQSFYPTPQNEARLRHAAFDEEGKRKDGESMNSIINRALDKFFSGIRSAAI